MRTIARSCLLIAAAAALPSCHRDWSGWSGWGDLVQVTIQNVGTASADVLAEATYWSGPEDHVAMTVLPGQWARFSFTYDRLSTLRVRIFRSTDDFEIFDETWNRDDLWGLDLRVSITTNP